MKFGTKAKMYRCKKHGMVTPTVLNFSHDDWKKEITVCLQCVYNKIENTLNECKAVEE
jgi:hypothetical protein